MRVRIIEIRNKPPILYKSRMNGIFYIKSNAWNATEPPLTLTKVKLIPLYKLQKYEKIKINTLNPQRKIVAIEQQVTS